MKTLIGILFLSLLLDVRSSNINIRTSTKFKNLVVQPFWKSTGLCPASDPKLRANFLLSDDEKLNFDFIGSLPNEGIKRVRIHWLLDLVTVNNIRLNKPIFNFHNLDRLIERLYRNGLSPTFELMGNPSNYFHDFTTQSKHWLELIKKIKEHYTSLYGISYVQNWLFELMNEPDLRQYNMLNFTIESYLNYFRTCEMAVGNVAGPAGLFRDNRKSHPLCWGLLDYCNLNPCNLNMITFHRKGGEVGSQVVEKGLELINSLISEFPNLKGVPFGNDEADIMTGWSKPLEWRADVRYAALVVQVIIGHIEEMLVKRNIPFKMLSNDNAFLSFSPNYFTQRTLLARFQMNNTKPAHVQFFRKPVYSVMTLLSLLGNRFKDIRYRPGERGFAYVVTSHKFQETFLAVIANDTVANQTYVVTDTDVYIKIVLGNLTVSGMCVGYIMDNLKTNPYEIWRKAGSPDYPNAELRREMRKVEGFEKLFIRKVKPNQTHVKFTLRKVPVPFVIAVNICFEGTEEPGLTTDLRYSNITRNEILLIWKDTLINNRCLLTYTIEFKKVGDSTFHRLNDEDSIFLSYHFDGIEKNVSEVGVAGEYRVAAVDYWGRLGRYSNVLVVSV